MRPGLLYIWAAGIAALFMIYIMFNIVTPVLGVIDTNLDQLFYTLGIDTTAWKSLYDYWIGVLRDFFGFLTVALFISFILYIIVNSARREPDVYSQVY